MKKILFPVVCAMCISPALAVNVKPFIGANLGITGVAYDEDIYDENSDAGIDMPEAFLGTGIEAGIIFQTPRIYNAGITVAYDYAFDTEADLDYYAEDAIDYWKQGFSAVSATFDNYLRVSGDAKHRQDIVLGIGLGRANSRFHMRTTPYGRTLGLEDIKDNDDDDTIVVFKIGYNYRVSSHFDWYLNGRWFMPSDDDVIKALFNASAGVRFVF